MEVKVIDNCKLDKHGKPKILSGTAGYIATHKFRDLYNEAEEKKCNILKRPVMKTIDGKIICTKYELIDR